MRKTIFTLSSTITMLVLSVAITLAQGACAEFIGRALEAVDSSCEGMGRNQACYGYNRVEASFQSEVADDFFNQPSDVTDVAELETLRTAPFNLDRDEWGVAVMVLQANMPDTLPGQNVTFVLMGDTEVENAVSADDAHQGGNGVDVAVTFPQGAAVRSGPGDNFNTIAGVVAGTIFTTDGISADGNWLRIVWEERPAWIRRTTVEQIAAIETLPVFNEELRTPMQAFYLRTGIGQPECEEVPDNSLLIQGPEDIQIDLTVNGANIELGSSGILRVLNPDSPQPELEITVLDGEFVIKADEFNPQDVVIQAGQRSTLCLEDGNNEGVNGEADDLIVNCGATAPETVETEEFQEEWCKLESLPGELLNYALSTCSLDTTPRTHTIQAGENLFRISQFYCVSLSDLTAFNGIADPAQIFVGQVILLPPDACDGSGSTRPPAGALPQPEVTPDPDNPAICAVQLISPLGDVNSGNHTFSWTPASVPGAVYYLVFYDFQGQRAEIFETTGTSYTVNLGQQTSTGGQFSWKIEVTSNGVFACESGRSPSITRLGDMNPPPAPSVLMSLSCTYIPSTLPLAEVTLSWTNLPAGESIVFSTTGAGSPPPATLTAPSGSIKHSSTSTSSTGTAVASTGDTIMQTC